MCLTPPPANRLAARLMQAGPPGCVRIASTARQLADAVAHGWPSVVVTDVLTSRSTSGLLAKMGGHRFDIVTVATADTETLRAVIAGLTTPQHEPRATRPVPTLTGRQLQIVGMVCDGLTNQQIADRLGIKSDTVKTHLSQALRLFGAASRTHLAGLAIRAGVVRSGP